MTGHASFPDAEKEQRVLQKAIEIIKQHVSQSSANDDAEERSPGDEVRDLIRSEIAVTAPRQVAVEQRSKKKSKNVSEPIPTEADSIAKADEEGTEIVNVEGEHPERL